MKYTVHRALAMLKITKARITKELASDEPFVRVARGQDGNVNGIPVAEIRPLKEKALRRLRHPMYWRILRKTNGSEMPR